MHVGHAELLEMVDAGFLSERGNGPFLSEGEEFTFVGDARRGMHRHVAMVHLVDDHVGEILHFGAFVGSPALGIGLREVDDGGALAVDAHGLGPYTGSLGFPFAVDLHLEGIEFAVELLGNGCTPHAVGSIPLHLEGLERSAGVAVVIKIHFHFLGLGAPEAEMSSALVNGQFEIVAVIDGP